MEIERCDPILRVDAMQAAVHFHSELLGFKPAPWGTDDFTCVARERAAIYLSTEGQGHTGAWVWIGVEDVENLHADLVAKGARIRMGPKNFPWALEMHVEDPSGNVLRFGSEPRSDRPFETAQF
jgi:predicted enzyme related to lactoylglutathione lyase